jgi:hypothetical protein
MLENHISSKHVGLLLSLIIGSTSLSTFSTAQGAYQSSGLIADWVGSSIVNASTNWSDSVSSQTLNQTSTTYVSSNGGYVTLNGSSSYLRDPNNLPTITEAATTTMSMFFWIKPTANQGVIVNLGRGLSPNNDADSEMLFTINGSGNLALWDYNGGTGFNNPTSSAAVTLNQWNYVGFTKSTSAGTATLTYYINGSASGSSTATPKAISLNDFVIGKDFRDNVNFFSGGVARASIWSTSLTSADVLNNYNATKGIAVAPSLTISNGSQSVSANSPIINTVINNSGGPASSFSISPALPSGLTMDSSGGISGSPTSTQSQTSYTITATNSAGSGTTTFTLTVLINTTTVTLGNIETATYRQPTTLTLTITGASGKVTFKQNGKNIAGCIKIPTITSGSIRATCSWKPSVRNSVKISAQYFASSSAYTGAVSSTKNVWVVGRTGTRQ